MGNGQYTKTGTDVGRPWPACQVVEAMNLVALTRD